MASMTPGLEERISQLLSGAGADRFQAVLAAVLEHFGADTGTIHRLAGDGHL
jgi:hypothetical protein